MLDIFDTDPFGVVALTEAINKVPFVPGQASTAVPWSEKGVTTDKVALESKAGIITLVNPTPRGGPGHTIGKNRRDLKVIQVPHYELDDGIYADEANGIREFGTEDQVAALTTIVNDRLEELSTLSLDPTIELQRIGALKGIILNADGSTLVDLFATMGEAQPASIQFNLDAATSSGVIRTKAAAVKRVIAAALGGLSFTGIGAFCGSGFFDKLIASKESRETYLNQQAANALRDPYAFGGFSFGGINWDEYRGATVLDTAGNVVTIGVPTEECILFPLGVSIYRTVFAPADYWDTVNTIGLPRYARQFPWENNKGRRLEVQTNSLSYVTRPGALVRGTHT